MLMMLITITKTSSAYWHRANCPRTIYSCHKIMYIYIMGNEHIMYHINEITCGGLYIVFGTFKIYIFPSTNNQSAWSSGRITLYFPGANIISA